MVFKNQAAWQPDYFSTMKTRLIRYSNIHWRGLLCLVRIRSQFSCQSHYESKLDSGSIWGREVVVAKGLFFLPESCCCSCCSLKGLLKGLSLGVDEALVIIGKSVPAKAVSTSEVMNTGMKSWIKSKKLSNSVSNPKFIVNNERRQVTTNFKKNYVLTDVQLNQFDN